MVVDALPLLDEFLVEAVPLVETGFEQRAAALEVHILMPVPLDEGGLDQTGRGVGVVLQHLGRPPVVAGVDEVEAGVEAGIAPPQGLRSIFDRLAGDAEVKHGIGFEGFLGEEGRSILRHAVQVLTHPLQQIHLAHGELVAGGFVPVVGDRAGDFVNGLVEHEALAGDRLLPAGSGCHRNAQHVRTPIRPWSHCRNPRDWCRSPWRTSRRIGRPW